MSRFTRLIVGSLAVGLLISPIRAKEAPATSLWSTQADRIQYAFSDNVYHALPGYRFTCRFLGSSDDTMVRLCASEKSQKTQDSQMFTRDVNGGLQAVSVVMNVDGCDTNLMATVIDGAMMSYMLGKVDDASVMLDRAKMARRRLLGDLQRKPRAVYAYTDATITAYIQGREIHVDIDKPQDPSSDE